MILVPDVAPCLPAGVAPGNMLPLAVRGAMTETARRKMADYRRRLRSRGLRPVQVWVPDLRDPQVRARLAAEACVVRDHPSTAEGAAFVDAALTDIERWED